MENGGGGFNKLTSMKRSNPRLKVLLAIGGWNEGSENYSKLAASPSRRQKFVKQSCQFIRQHGFDGLDIDWEYPADRGGVPEDKQNFVSLVRELRNEFSSYGLMLTAAIGASIDKINRAYDIRALSQSLDYINVMTYDYGGHWDNRVTANAPMTGNGPCIVNTIDHLIRMGAPPSKLVLGVPFYGRTFTASGSGNFNDSANGSFNGPYTRENGFMGYNEICEIVNQGGWSTSYNSGGCQVISKQNCGGSTKVIVYDDARTISDKSRYARDKGLAGVMVWSVDTDDFLNNYPLLRAINSVLG